MTKGYCVSSWTREGYVVRCHIRRADDITPYFHQHLFPDTPTGSIEAQELADTVNARMATMTVVEWYEHLESSHHWSHERPRPQNRPHRRSEPVA